MHPGDLFGIRPPNRQAIWQKLTDFFTAWFGPLTPKCGVPAASILRAERELGIDLPAAVREAYLGFGARLELTRGSCRLNRIDTLCIEAGALLVWFDKDDMALWGILLEHLDNPDPPVHVAMNCEDRLVQEHWRDTGLRFSEVFLERALHLAAEASPYRDYADQDAGTHALVEQHFVRLDFPDNDYPLAPTRMYGGDDVIVLVEGEACVLVGAPSMEGYGRGLAPLAHLPFHARTEEDAYRGTFAEQLELDAYCRELFKACAKHRDAPRGDLS